MIVQRPSPNHGGKLTRPSLITIHYTAGRTAESAVNWLCNPLSKASAHFVIGRDSTTYQLVPTDVVAWHAGQSRWGLRTGVNSFSIGIELDNPGFLHKTTVGYWRSPSTGEVYQPEDVIEGVHKHGTAKVGWLLYTENQLNRLYELGRELVDQFPSLQEIAGHDDISPGRKWDPGFSFDMDAARTSIFGRK